MFLDRFHSVQDGHVVISALQASQFAKEIAGDFNPIHDPDARRFCVPGDLLFAIVLARFGLSENMTFRFRSLLGENVPLKFVETENTIDVCDDAGKVSPCDASQRNGPACDRTLACRGQPPAAGEVGGHGPQ